MLKLSGTESIVSKFHVTVTYLTTVHSKTGAQKSPLNIRVSFTNYHIEIMQKYILPSSTSILEFTADLIIDTLWRFMIGLGISFNYIESRKRLLFTYLSIA